MRDPNTGKSNTCTITVTNPSVTVPSGGGSSGSGGGSGYSGGWSAWWTKNPNTGEIKYYSSETAMIEGGYAISKATGNKQVEGGYVNSDTGSHKTNNLWQGSAGTKINMDSKGNIKSDTTTTTSTRGGGGTTITTTQYNYTYTADGRISRLTSTSTSRFIADPPPPASGGSGGGNSSSCCYSPPRPSKRTCFPAGTLVQTENGLKNIEEIKVGDNVLSYNLETNKQEYNPVIKTYIHKDTSEDLYQIYYEDDVLEVTEKHPIYINNSIYENNISKYNCKNHVYDDYHEHLVYAKDLKIGDYLLGSDGNYHMITNIKHHKNYESVYNIDVENNYNYYAGTNGILVTSR